MAGDANYAGRLLGLHGNGANAGVVFTDNSPTPKVVTPFGNVQTSTAQSMFNGSSIKFDGAGDYLLVGAVADWALGSSDFTMAMWLFLISFTTARLINNGEIGGSIWPLCELQLNPTGAISFTAGYQNTNSASTLTSSNSCNVGAWNYIEISRVGTLFTIFINGVSGGTMTWNHAFLASTVPLCIGAYKSGASYTAQALLNGHMAEIEFLKNTGRHTANYTPPAIPFYDGMGQVGGVIRDASGALCSRTVRLIRRDTGAHLVSGVSNASTGAYSLATPTLDEVVRIVHSNTTTAPLENDLIDRVVPA